MRGQAVHTGHLGVVTTQGMHLLPSYNYDPKVAHCLLDLQAAIPEISYSQALKRHRGRGTAELFKLKHQSLVPLRQKQGHSFSSYYWLLLRKDTSS